MPQNRSSLTAAARFLRLLSLMATLAGLFLFGSQRADAQKKEDKDEPKKELNVAVDEDFKKLKLGALPKGWGGDFSAGNDAAGVRCLVCDKQMDFHYLKMPKMNLKGDIVIECEYILFTTFNGSNGHNIGISLESARGEKIALLVTSLGGVHLHDTLPRPTGGFQANQKTRVRFAREEGIFSVHVNGKEVTGVKIAEPAGPFVAVHIGMHAGAVNGNTAKLYSVKVSSEGKLVVPMPGGDPEEKSKPRPKPKDTEIDEDFRDTKVGNIPKGWTSGASKVGAQVAGERRRLELVNQGIGVDYAELPSVELKKDFFVECSFLMLDKKTSVLLHISDGKQQFLNLQTIGEGQILARATKGIDKYDISKTLKLQGEENMLRLERKDDEYILKLNAVPVASFPTNVARGPFNVVRVFLGVADKTHRSPAITRIRVRALDNIEN